MLQSKFIVIEGLEGAGKSTAVSVVKNFLTQNGCSEVVECREPGGTKLGEYIRHLLKNNETNENIAIRSELLLMYVSRIQLVENVIKPALAQGKCVVCDRFFYSTFAYQGGGRGIDLQMVEAIHQVSLGNFKPDLTLYLDILPEVGLQRAAKRGELDRFEREKLEFFQKTRDVYLKLLNQQPEMVAVDASLSQELVAEQIVNNLKARLF